MTISELILKLQDELRRNGNAPVWIEDEEPCRHFEFEIYRELVERFPAWNILTGKQHATDLIIKIT